MSGLRWAVLALLAACSGDDTDATKTVSTDTGDCDPTVRWDTFAQPMLSTWCTPCHSGDLEGAERSGAPEGLDFDSYEQVVGYAELIRASIDDERMPPVGGLSDADRATFGAWVDCGLVGSESTTPTTGCEAPTPQTTLDCSVATHVVLDGDLVASDQDLSCLCAVDGTLTIAGLVDAPQLETVGALQTDTSATALTARALHAVAGPVSLAAPGLGTVDLPALERVDGSITVSGTALERFELPRLDHVGGDLRVETNAFLTAGLRFASVATIDGSVALVDNDAMPAFTLFGHLERVDGDIVLMGNDDALSIVGLFQLAELGGRLQVDGHRSLRGINVGLHLQSLGGGLWVRDNPGLFSVETFPALTVLGAADPTAGLWLRGNPRLSAFEALPALQAAGSVQVEAHAALATLGPINVASLAGDLSVIDNDVLSSLGAFGLLETVGGDLTITGNPSLPAAAASTLEAVVGVGGTSTVSGNGP